MDYQNIFKAGTGKSVADMYADFQGAFTELAQIYKSTTEPSPTYACQWWADETSGLLKQRNADNTAWIVRGYLDKPFFGLVPYVDNGAVSPLLTGRNRLINGNFDPKIGWQRGTSFALGSGETKFTADRYRCTQGTGGVGTVSMQSVTPAAVPGARGSLRWQQTTAASTAPEIMQPVEGADTFSGSVCTRGFWAKADATRTIQVALRQNFGTGGSPSPSVDIATQSFTIGTAWQFVQATFIVPDTSAKMFGTGCNDYLGARIILPVGVTFDIQFTLDQLEPGNMATGFEYRSMAQELTLCQRYYEKGFPLDIAPGPNSIFYQCFHISGTGSTIDGYSNFTTQFKVTKRATPSITTYNATTAGGNAVAYLRNDGTWYNGSHGGTTICDKSFSIGGSYVGAGSVMTNRTIAFNWTADAEL